jgi:hypothetical protein
MHEVERIKGKRIFRIMSAHPVELISRSHLGLVGICFQESDGREEFAYGYDNPPGLRRSRARNRPRHGGQKSSCGYFYF